MKKNKLEDSGVNSNELDLHYSPRNFSDRFAYFICKSLKWTADMFFQKRYGHRAVVLETIAAVPGMVGAMLTHFKCLRKQCNDEGWIKILLEEAENERMHLMIFIKISKINWVERMLVILAQIIFSLFFFLLYLFFPKTAHRLVGYFEEEAIKSYSSYLIEIDKGTIPNVSAPKIAIDYWKLAPDAKLRDVVIAVLKDEANHRNVNHHLSDQL